ncbi:glycerophosphodiester phosphodiesterase family protein [Parasediminibacterium paludis]|uniref:Glycerophosphodiester phosphodiesterase family protein n=1 Tax=Parasediminibacterium paludis TaxID=908966 RepID=A0ABV8PWI3_9BACT
MKKIIVFSYFLTATILCNAQINTKDPRYSTWKNGIYLNQRQKEVMGYLSSWNPNDPLNGGEKRVIVSAHRGLWGVNSGGENPWRDDGNYYRAENTVGSFFQTFKLNDRKGVEMVEMDIRLTKDQVPILMHDETVGRILDPNFDPIPHKAASNYNNFKVNSKSWNTILNRFYDTRQKANVWLNGGVEPIKKTNEGTGSNNAVVSLLALAECIMYEYAASANRVGLLDYPIDCYPILALDIKDPTALAACIRVLDRAQSETVTAFHININWRSWVIFKINALDMLDGKERNNNIFNFKRFEKISGIANSDMTRYNIVPYFFSRAAEYFNIEACVAAMIKKPWFLTMEVHVKEGSLLDKKPECRYFEINQLARTYKNLKLGIQHALPTAYYPPGDIPIGRNFAGNGACCFPYSTYYANFNIKPENATKLDKDCAEYKTRSDRNDLRWNRDFLEANILNVRQNNGWAFRWITTDEPTEWFSYLGANYGIKPTISDNTSSILEPSSNYLDSSTNINTTTNLARNVDSLNGNIYDIAGDSDINYLPVISCTVRTLPYSTKKFTSNIFDNPYFIGLDGSVNTLDSNHAKISLGGKAIDIAVEEDGTPWHIGVDNKVYMLDSSNNWQNIPGLAQKIAIGGSTEESADYVNDRQKIAIIGIDNNIYTFNTATGLWDLTATTNAKELSIDRYGDIWFIDMNNKIWHFDGDTLINTRGIGTKISCSLDGAVATIGSDNNIWGYNRTTDRWQRVFTTDGTFTDLTLISTINAYAIKANGEIWTISDSCSTNSGTFSNDNAIASTNTNFDELNASKISIFPNPAHNKVTVQLPVGMEEATVTIFSDLGATVAIDNGTGLLRQISIASKPSGTYLVRVTTKKGNSTTQKLLIQ